MVSIAIECIHVLVKVSFACEGISTSTVVRVKHSITGHQLLNINLELVRSAKQKQFLKENVVQ